MRAWRLHEGFHGPPQPLPGLLDLRARARRGGGGRSFAIHQATDAGRVLCRFQLEVAGRCHRQPPNALTPCTLRDLRVSIPHYYVGGRLAMFNRRLKVFVMGGGEEKLFVPDIPQ